MNKLTRVHLDITGKCNLRCMHCHMADFYQQEISLENLLHILDNIKKKGINRITLAGGEPFIRKDILTIISNCPEDVSIITNGTKLNSSLLKKLRGIEEKQSKIITMRISLDGLEANKDIRGVSCDEILKKIEMVRKYGFVTVVNTTLSKFIRVGELKKMLQILEKLNVDQWNIDIPFSEGSYKKNNLSLNLELIFTEIKGLIKTYMANSYKMKMDVVGIFSSDMIKENKQLPILKMQDHPCSYQFGSVAINPKGEILLCPSLHISFGRYDEIDTYRANKKWQDFRNHTRKSPEGCRSCKYLPICGGGCRANALTYGGDLWGKDFLSCELMHFLEKDLISIYPKEVQEKFYKIIKK